MISKRAVSSVPGLVFVLISASGGPAAAQPRLFVANQGGHNPPLATDNGVIQYPRRRDAPPPE